MVPGDEPINIFYRADLFLEVPHHYKCSIYWTLKLKTKCISDANTQLYRVITEFKRLKHNNSSLFQNPVFILSFQPQNKEKRGKKKNTKNGYNEIFPSTNIDWKLNLRPTNQVSSHFFYSENMESMRGSCPRGQQCSSPPPLPWHSW